MDKTDASVGNYALLKETIASVAGQFAKYFPDTLLVPSLGNNDGKYHYSGEDSANKADYYGAYFQDFFGSQPFNKRLPELREVKRTLMSGGYFRVDVDSKLSILSVNTLYLNKKNDATAQAGTEAQEILDWMRQQLASAGRKFIITNHIYAGAKYDGKSKDLLTPDFNQKYFALLQEFHDKIVIEGVAHDHYADVRYHSSGDSVTPKYFYHNMIVSPGVTPIDGSNPGVAIFEVNAGTMAPQNLVLHFISLEKTYGWKSVPTDLSIIPFREV